MAGRILLVVIFVVSGVGKIANPEGTERFMASMGMPLTEFFLGCAVVLELGGAASVLLGYRARLGAILLIIFMIPTTFIFHRDFSNPLQVIMFLKNTSMTGGLLMLAAFGPGPFSLDGLLALSKSKES